MCPWRMKSPAPPCPWRSSSRRRTGRFMFGAGINSDAGVTGQIMIDERNFDLSDSREVGPTCGRHGVSRSRTGVPDRSDPGQSRPAIPGQFHRTLPVRHARQLERERLSVRPPLLRLDEVSRWRPIGLRLSPDTRLVRRRLSAWKTSRSEIPACSTPATRPRCLARTTSTAAG